MSTSPIMKCEAAPSVLADEHVVRSLRRLRLALARQPDISSHHRLSVFVYFYHNLFIHLFRV